jgi:hypothetical protein
MMSWRLMLVVLLVALKQQESTSRRIRSAVSEHAAGEAQQQHVGQLSTPRCSVDAQAPLQA